MATDEENIQHLKNKFLIDKFSPNYTHSNHSVYQDFMHAVHHKLDHHHHHAIIDTSNVVSPKTESLSESQKVDRATYALWKLYRMNPDFFNDYEAETLYPRQPRAVRSLIYHGTNFATGAYIWYSVWFNKFSVKTIGVLAAARAGQMAFTWSTNRFYETAKMSSRRGLAREYMGLMGEDELCSIANPDYSVAKIKDMMNPKILSFSDVAAGL